MKPAKSTTPAISEPEAAKSPVQATEDSPPGDYKFANLRVENRGAEWRMVYEEKDVRKASPWRRRNRFWVDMGQFLGFQKEFVFRGMGKIPLPSNSIRATREG